MDKPVIRISVRNLVEFILRSGDLDSTRGGMDREAMQKGSRNACCFIWIIAIPT